MEILQGAVSVTYNLESQHHNPQFKRDVQALSVAHEEGQWHKIKAWLLLLQNDC